MKLIQLLESSAYLPFVGSVAFHCTCMLSSTFFFSVLLFICQVFDFSLNRMTVEIEGSVEIKKVKIEEYQMSDSSLSPSLLILVTACTNTNQYLFMWKGSIVNADIQTKNYTWLCFEILVKNLSNHSLLGKRVWLGLIQLSRPEGNVISSVDWVPGTVTSGGKFTFMVTWFRYQKNRHRSPSVFWN